MLPGEMFLSFKDAQQSKNLRKKRDAQQYLV